ncbi:MAG: MFS transporter [Polyangia bacterium]
MSARPAEDRRLILDLRLFVAYRFLSTAYLFVPVLVLFFQERGLDFKQIALLNTVYALTAIVFEVPTGVLADRFGRRRAMIAGALLMAAGCLVDYRGTSFWTFAIGEAFLALGLTLSSGADSAYLYDLLRDVGRSDRYRALEGRATAAKLVGSAGALLAGGLIARHHLADTYAVSAIVCVAAALVAALLGERLVASTTVKRMTPDYRRDASPDRVNEGSVWAAMRSAALVSLRRPRLRTAILFSVITFTLLRMSLYLQPTWLASEGLDVAWIGAVLAALSLVAAVGAEGVETLRRRLDERALVVLLPAVIGVAYLALPRCGWPLGILLLAVLALGNGVYSPLSKDLLNREITDSGQRATVLSVESMARRLVFGGFAPLAGMLIDDRGLSSGIQATGLLGLCGAVLLLGAMWMVQRAPIRLRSAGAPPARLGFGVTEGQTALTPETEGPKV